MTVVQGLALKALHPLSAAESWRYFGQETPALPFRKLTPALERHLPVHLCPLARGVLHSSHMRLARIWAGVVY